MGSQASRISAQASASNFLRSDQRACVHHTLPTAKGHVVMSMVLHFLNVGHGDCTIIELPSGRLMMIDINNSKSLPDGDIDALAEHQGMSRSAFKSARTIEG